MYELLALQPPFVEPSLLHKVLTANPLPLPEHYNTGLKEVVFRTLDKDPGQRPGSTELLQNDEVARHVGRWLIAAHTKLVD